MSADEMNSARAPQPGGYPPGAFLAAATVAVPDLVTMWIEDAILALTAVGLVVGVQSTTGGDSGIVFGQSPSAGSIVAVGSAVDVTVGEGLPQ